MSTVLERALARLLAGRPEPHVNPLMGKIGTDYVRRWVVRGRHIQTTWRCDNFQGRFGAGWNWCLGVELGADAMILNLMTFMLKVEFKPRTDDEHQRDGVHARPQQGNER